MIDVRHEYIVYVYDVHVDIGRRRMLDVAKNYRDQFVDASAIITSSSSSSSVEYLPCPGFPPPDECVFFFVRQLANLAFLISL